MKRILDRTSKAAAKPSTSVQPFAGGILNKYKTGAGRNNFGRLAMSHVMRSQPNVIQQTLQVQVVAPKADASKVNNSKKAVPSPERKIERIIERERVTVERETIVFRDITHVVKEQRTVREIAIMQPAGEQGNQETVQQRLLEQRRETAAVKEISKRTRSERTIPQSSLAPIQALKAEQQADSYKWLLAKAKLHPNIVIQSVSKLDMLIKPLAKERAHLTSIEKGRANRYSALQLTNARRGDKVQEQQTEQDGKVSRALAKMKEQADAAWQEEAGKRTAAMGKEQRETAKRSDAVRVEQEEAGKRTAALGKEQREAAKRSDAVRVEQEEAEKRTAALSKEQRETAKRSDALARTLRDHEEPKDEGVSSSSAYSAQGANGNKPRRLEHRAEGKHSAEQAESSALADIKVNDAAIQAITSGLKKKTVNLWNEQRQLGLKVTATSTFDYNRNRLLTLKLQREPQQIAWHKEPSDGKSRFAINAKRLIHRSHHKQADQTQHEADNSAAANPITSSMAKPVVPPNRKLAADNGTKPIHNDGRKQFKEISAKEAPTAKGLIQPPHQAGSLKRSVAVNISPTAQLKVAAIRERMISPRLLQMVLRRYDQKRSNPTQSSRKQSGQNTGEGLNRVGKNAAEGAFEREWQAGQPFTDDRKGDQASFPSSRSGRAIVHRQTKASPILGASPNDNEIKPLAAHANEASGVNELKKPTSAKTSGPVSSLPAEMQLLVTRGQLVARATSNQAKGVRANADLSHTHGGARANSGAAASERAAQTPKAQAEKSLHAAHQAASRTNRYFAGEFPASGLVGANRQEAGFVQRAAVRTNQPESGSATQAAFKSEQPETGLTKRLTVRAVQANAGSARRATVVSSKTDPSFVQRATVRMSQADTGSEQRLVDRVRQSAKGLLQRSTVNVNQSTNGLTQRSADKANQTAKGLTQRSADRANQTAKGLTQRTTDKANQTAKGLTQRSADRANQTADGLTIRSTDRANQTVEGLTPRKADRVSQPTMGLTQLATVRTNQLAKDKAQQATARANQLGLGSAQQAANRTNQTVRGNAVRTANHFAQLDVSLTQRVMRGTTHTAASTAEPSASRQASGAASAMSGSSAPVSHPSAAQSRVIQRSISGRISPALTAARAVSSSQRQHAAAPFQGKVSAAGTQLLQTVQRHAGRTGIASNANIGYEAPANLTTVVQARNERFNQAQATSTGNEQARLSYAVTAGNQRAADSLIASVQGTSPSPLAERGSMPTLAHHKPKQAAVQEPPRQVKVDAPRELDPEKLQKMIMKMPQLRPEAIADQVYKALERKMKLEQRRRGF
ncbi:hypothetical protein [Bacillus sp. FJAT-26390]|uniref:hypothetical protein n=1 Tax=Bacillus sp. FJAT-26390 TaxID=1743142 RepID=UPI000808001D|nr:hypothetical protein [Bacillus sp. FJAT-26390]OBZ12261.1 hypothetical protein A7975_14565 [Bacillus sp. FJAT-26390]